MVEIKQKDKMIELDAGIKEIGEDL
jgi:hypothetical protein